MRHDDFTSCEDGARGFEEDLALDEYESDTPTERELLQDERSW